MTCNTKLKNIDIEQLAEIFKQKQSVVTQDRFILDRLREFILLNFCSPFLFKVR